MRDLPHPIGELVPHRLVQSEDVALLVDDRLRDGRACVLERDDVAGDRAHDDEGEDRDSDEGRDHEQEPPDDIPAHPASLERLPLGR